MWATFSRECGVFALPSMVNGEQGNTERKYGGFWQSHSTGSYFKMSQKNIPKLWESPREGSIRQPWYQSQLTAPSHHPTRVLHHVPSWSHLGLLVFQCDPVAWVCLKSFLGGAYFVFCLPNSDGRFILENGCLGSRTTLRKPETIHWPGQEVSFKTNPRLLTSTHVEAATCSCTWISDNAALTWSHCHCFTTLRWAQQSHRWGFIMDHQLSQWCFFLFAVHVWVFSKFSRYLSKSKSWTLDLKLPPDVWVNGGPV